MRATPISFHSIFTLLAVTFIVGTVAQDSGQRLRNNASNRSSVPQSLPVRAPSAFLYVVPVRLELPLGYPSVRGCNRVCPNHLGSFCASLTQELANVTPELLLDSSFTGRDPTAG